MGWITFTIVATVVLLAFAVMAARSAFARRSDRLEAAFFRAPAVDFFAAGLFTPCADAAFVPFGAGVHKCIGMRFATMVLKVLIHHLLYDRRIEMRSGYTLAWDTTALPAPADDFPVLIRRGNDSQKSVTAAT